MHFQKSILALSISLLAACDGSSSSNNQGSSNNNSNQQLENHKIIDPDAAADRTFGSHTVELTSGNIAIISGIESVSSAAHIYTPLTKQVIGSFYSDGDYDFVDDAHLTALSNGNLVLAIPSDEVNGVRVGSVKLINGAPGAQINIDTGNDTYDVYVERGTTTPLVLFP